MGTLDQVLPPHKRARVLHWLISRQMGKGGGFQGRPHKAIDTCYSFWVGSSLHLLGMGGLADAEANRAFLMTTQNSKGGGFAKWPDTMADPLHAYMGISGLALQREPGLAAVHPALNFSRKAAAHVGPPWWRGPAFAAVSVGVIFALRAWRP
jgi:geranylgeranyl transferase type-1 subunit beta